MMLGAAALLAKKGETRVTRRDTAGRRELGAVGADGSRAQLLRAIGPWVIDTFFDVSVSGQVTRAE